MFTHILVPTDGSKISHVAEDKAIDLAVETGAKLTFLHVMHEPPFPVSDFSESGRVDKRKPVQFVEEEISIDKKILSRATAHAQTRGIEADALTETSADPYLAIIAVAERLRCDLIFMASHGRRGLNALLLGSETQKVLTHCTIPVLVFR